MRRALWLARRETSETFHQEERRRDRTRLSDVASFLQMPVQVCSGISTIRLAACRSLVCSECCSTKGCVNDESNRHRNCARFGLRMSAGERARHGQVTRRNVGPCRLSRNHTGKRARPQSSAALLRSSKIPLRVGRCRARPNWRRSIHRPVRGPRCTDRGGDDPYSHRHRREHSSQHQPHVIRVGGQHETRRHTLCLRGDQRAVYLRMRVGPGFVFARVGFDAAKHRSSPA